MKLLKTGALVALLTALNAAASAQGPAVPVNEPDYNKPKIFADLPDRLQLRVTDMEALLHLPVGAMVNATVAPGLTLSGVVVSKSNPKDASVRSIVIKSVARNNATFTFTRTSLANGNVNYIGRMVSKSSGDALEIVKEGNEYVIRKRAYHDLISE